MVNGQDLYLLHRQHVQTKAITADRQMNCGVCYNGSGVNDELYIDMPIGVGESSNILYMH